MLIRFAPAAIVFAIFASGTLAHAQQPVPAAQKAPPLQNAAVQQGRLAGQQPGQQAPPLASQDPNTPQIQASDADGTPNFLTPFDYDPRGRRDPFQPPADEKPVEQGSVHGPFLPLQKFDIAQIKLSAIIWDVAHPKAMLTDPDGKVFIVGPNTKIGKNNGYIAVIREGEMVIIETTEENGRLLSATRILRLAAH
jgi:type IV pilus assembly protein PilP